MSFKLKFTFTPVLLMCCEGVEKVREKRRPWRVERGDRGVNIRACAIDSRVVVSPSSSLQSLTIEGISREVERERERAE
jgi:hypothetical protein